MGSELLDIDTARSYQKEQMLKKALEANHLDRLRHVIVCNREGRFTAVFTLNDGDGIRAAHCGFPVVGG